MEPLVLPRQLVQEIFHQAQVAPGGGTLGLMVRREDGKLELAGIPLDADINGLMVGLAVHKWTPVAVYRSSMTATEESPAEQLAAWRGLAPLLLSVSLGTTGVLQLRGWGSQEGELQAVDVSLGDEPSPG
jgi:hypothetical protein